MHTKRSLTLAVACAALSIAFNAQAQETAEQHGVPANAASTDPNFEAAAKGKGAIPLTPEMIDELAKRYDAAQRATARVGDPGEVASPVERSINVSLGPGGVTSIIQTVAGFPTAISFLDTTGQPWPIAWDTNSNPAHTGEAASTAQNAAPAVSADGLEVKVPVRGSNVLQITPISTYPRGGLLVSLQDAPKPIAFMVIAGKGRYDANVTVRVADRGPKAKARIITRPNAPETGAADLTAMLDGVPPAEAAPLTVSGIPADDIRAWRLGDRVYLRTRYTVLSPEWVASEDGEDGVSIYALPTTPVVLLSDDGRTVAARLKDE